MARLFGGNLRGRRALAWLRHRRYWFTRMQPVESHAMITEAGVTMITEAGVTMVTEAA